MIFAEEFLWRFGVRPKRTDLFDSNTLLNIPNTPHVPTNDFFFAFSKKLSEVAEE